MLMMILTASDPPVFAWHALPLMAGAVIAVGGICGVPLLRGAPLPVEPNRFGAADVAVAVAWNFTQMYLPEIVTKAAHPHLQAFSEVAEQLPVFLDTPAA